MKFVRPRGPFQSLALGGQPYGVLPVSSLAGWRTAQAAEDPLAKILNAMRAQLAEGVGKRSPPWAAARTPARTWPPCSLNRPSRPAGWLARFRLAKSRRPRSSGSIPVAIPECPGSVAPRHRRRRARAAGADRAAASSGLHLRGEPLRVERSAPAAPAGAPRNRPAAGQLHRRDRRRDGGRVEEPRRHRRVATHAPLPAAAPRHSPRHGARGRPFRTSTPGWWRRRWSSWSPRPAPSGPGWRSPWPRSATARSPRFSRALFRFTRQWRSSRRTGGR